MKKGFTLVEVLIVIVIMGIIAVFVTKNFTALSGNQAVQKDTDLIVETLRQARSQTMASHNASQYGVYIASTSITLFNGQTYLPGVSTNRTYNLNQRSYISAINLQGGATSIVFNRLNGETVHYGTILLASPSSSTTRTVTIRKTGVIESH